MVGDLKNENCKKGLVAYKRLGIKGGIATLKKGVKLKIKIT